MSLGAKGFRGAIDLLHETAAQQTGLSDFGDGSYRSNLEFLLDCYEAEAHFTEQGRLLTLRSLVDCLKGRLYSTHHQARLSLAATVVPRPIERPLVIAGLPRTGSTALHKLLAADPGSQALEYWLGREPDVRPERSQWPSHPSYRAAVASLDEIYQGAPEFRAAHSMKAGEADECRLLFMQDFLNVSFSFNATIPSFEDWVLEQDMHPAYARYRDNLALIGANDGDKRWVLKNSSHLWALPALEHTFPDVCLVQTHRNPLEWISSIASLVYKSRVRFEPDVRKEEVGEQQLRQWSRVIERCRVDRAGLAAEICDVHYEHFVRDPIGTIRRIYEHFDWRWSPTGEKAIRQWADEHRQDQHGEHRYSAAEYGLSDERIEEQFGDYIEWEQAILGDG